MTPSFISLKVEDQRRLSKHNAHTHNDTSYVRDPSICMLHYKVDLSHLESNALDSNRACLVYINENGYIMHFLLYAFMRVGIM